MPVYEYKCLECHKVSEIFSKTMKQEKISCLFCNSVNLEKIYSVPGQVRVAGNKPKGSTCCGREERCDKPPCSAGGICER